MYEYRQLSIRPTLCILCKTTSLQDITPTISPVGGEIDDSLKDLIIDTDIIGIHGFGGSPYKLEFQTHITRF